MAKLAIIGGAKLTGKIKVAGNKNSVLPIIAACLLTEDTCILENVPNISDVAIMAKLLEICGAKVSGVGTPKLTINCQTVKTADFPPLLTEKLRASVLLLGPLLSRVGKIKMGYPGGDIIGRRPLDSHIQAIEALGAIVDKLNGAEIFLQEASVTATENAVITASLAHGETVIKRAASEPHVVDLCQFLIKMGANISGVGTNVLKI